MATAFAKAFENKAKKTFNEAKKYKHKAGNSFGPVPVPDGSFTAIVTIDTSVPTKGKMEGVPIVTVKSTIDQGPYEGLEPKTTLFCEGKPILEDERATAEQELIGLLGFLLPDIQIDEVSQVPQAIELVNERGPRVEVGVRNTTDKVDKNKKYQNVYYNKVLKHSTFDQSSSTEHVAKDSSAQETTQSDDSAERSVDSDTYVPSKGDMVSLDDDDSGTEWEVLQVSQARQTVNLSDSEGNRKNGEAWSKLQPI